MVKSDRSVPPLSVRGQTETQGPPGEALSILGWGWERGVGGGEPGLRGKRGGA